MKRFDLLMLNRRVLLAAVNDAIRQKQKLSPGQFSRFDELSYSVDFLFARIRRISAITGRASHRLERRNKRLARLKGLPAVRIKKPPKIPKESMYHTYTDDGHSVFICIAEVPEVRTDRGAILRHAEFKFMSAYMEGPDSEEWPFDNEEEFLAATGIQWESVL